MTLVRFDECRSADNFFNMTQAVPYTQSRNACTQENVYKFLCHDMDMHQCMQMHTNTLRAIVQYALQCVFKALEVIKTELVVLT